MATRRWVAISVMEVRRCPTLPQGPPCSTIGAERLSFRVRNGTGRFPLAMAAETLSMSSVLSQREKLSSVQLRFPTVHREPLSGREHSQPTLTEKGGGGKCFQVIGLLVPVSCTRCRASTSGLSTQ